MVLTAPTTSTAVVIKEAMFVVLIDNQKKKSINSKLCESNKVVAAMIFGSIVIQNFFSHTDFPQGNEEQKRSFS